MNAQIAPARYQIGHSLLLAIGILIAFFLVHVSSTIFTFLERLVDYPLVGILDRPYLAEAAFLGWFVLSSYWFFAFVDEKKAWNVIGVGFLLGYSYVLWALSMFATPILIGRHLIQVKNENKILKIPHRSFRLTRETDVQKGIKTIMSSWKMVRKLIIEGKTVLKEVYADSDANLLQLVNHMEMELGWSPEQINRIFFTWYGIAHEYSYDMVLKDYDPSDPADVKKYMQENGMNEMQIRSVLSIMPRLNDTADLGFRNDGNSSHEPYEPHFFDPKDAQACHDEKPAATIHHDNPTIKKAHPHFVATKPEDYLDSEQEKEKRKALVEDAPSIDPEDWIQQ